MPAVWSEFAPSSPLSFFEARSSLQRAAAADDNAFLRRGTDGVQRIVDAVLALLHLGLGGAADVDGAIK